MGLDQYLNAKKYLSPSEWRGEESRQQFDTIVKAVGADTFMRKEFPNAEVSISVGYWRKANAIHNWFVDNCQHGKDDCRQSIVTREQLQELKRLCEIVTMDKGLLDTDESAKTMLPVAMPEGSFFGSDKYDEYYYKAMTDTIAIVTACLDMPAEWDFYYQSSW